MLSSKGLEWLDAKGFMMEKKCGSYGSIRVGGDEGERASVCFSKEGPVRLEFVMCFTTDVEAKGIVVVTKGIMDAVKMAGLMLASELQKASDVLHGPDADLMDRSATCTDAVRLDLGDFTVSWASAGDTGAFGRPWFVHAKSPFVHMAACIPVTDDGTAPSAQVAGVLDGLVRDVQAAFAFTR